MRLKSIIILVLLIAGVNSTFARRYNPYGTDWAFGVHFGGTAFFGDLRAESSGFNNSPFSKYFYQDVRLMGGVTLDKWFGPYIGMTGNIQFGKIQGTKETSHAYFEANLFEYNLSAMVNLSNVFFGVDTRRNAFMYYSLGIGMSESRTWKYHIETEQLIGTNGFGKPRSEGGSYVPMTETIVVTGLGVKVFIGRGLTLSFEGNVHIINSDKLDATPNDNSSFIAGLEGYVYYNIGLQYNFGFNGRYSTIRYRHRSRYNSGKGRMVEINTRKRSKHRRKQFKRRRRSFKFKRR